jgi:hypothetical protein
VECGKLETRVNEVERRLPGVSSPSPCLDQEIAMHFFIRSLVTPTFRRPSMREKFTDMLPVQSLIL